MKIHTIIAVLLVLFVSTVSAQEQQKQDLRQQPLDESGWKAIYTPAFIAPNTSLMGIQFPSKDTGYVVYNNGNSLVLLRSINAGQTWDSISSQLPTVPRFYNSTLGYALLNDTCWKTTDGGFTWKLYHAVPALFGRPTFFDSDTGITLGVGRSTDGGQTWKRVLQNFAYDLNESELGIASKKVAYVVGNYTKFDFGNPLSDGSALVLKSTDVGLTWDRIRNNKHDNFYACQAFDEQVLYAFSQYGNFYRSTNGSVNWDSIFLVDSKTKGLTGMSFIDKGHGVLVGWGEANHVPSSFVFYTNDSGKTWQPQPFPSIAERLYWVAMLNDSIVYAAGEKSLYRTTTAGKPSTVHQHTIDFHVQTFPNPSPGFLTIQYQLPTTSSVSFRFYDLQGQTLSVVNPGIQEAGLHQIQYDGTSLSNGMYFFQLSTPVDSYTGQFSILK